MKHETVLDVEGNEIHLKTFEEILPLLKNGEFVRRAGWSPCFAIYMPLRHFKEKGAKVFTPSVGDILLFEASRLEHGSPPYITIGWKPHTRDFLASDWYCVDMTFSPRVINPSYKPPEVVPIDNINDISY
jgi:hypothetical protein